jgi:hypothetical protein
MESAEDGERRVTEEGEKKVGLELGWEAIEMGEERWEGQESGQGEIRLKWRLGFGRGRAAWRSRRPDGLGRRRTVGRGEGRWGSSTIDGG